MKEWRKRPSTLDVTAPLRSSPNGLSKEGRAETSLPLRPTPEDHGLLMSLATIARPPPSVLPKMELWPIPLEVAGDCVVGHDDSSDPVRLA
jgi:hypothetical protein